MAGLGPQLEATGAAEFWNRAWSEKRTMWKLSEMQVNTFARNIFYFVMGLPSHQGNPCTLPFIATNDSNKADQLHQPEMERAVRDFITKKNVLVPLCGDTEAVRFMIEHGASLVVGADLSRAALESLMSTHFSDWKFNTRSVANDAAVVFEGHSEKHTDQSVMLFCGDYLRLVDCPDFAQLKVDFIYDRAAYMAMHPSLRQEYTAVAAKVLQPGAAGVLLERPRREEGDVRGPPFTFCVDEARRFYETATGRSFTLKALVEDRWRADPEGKSPVLFFDWHGLYPSS